MKISALKERESVILLDLCVKLKTNLNKYTKCKILNQSFIIDIDDKSASLGFSRYSSQNEFSNTIKHVVYNKQIPALEVEKLQ